MKKDTLGALIGLGVCAAAFLWCRKHTKGTSGIGALKKQPRRIWKEVEQAQKHGIDLTDPEGWKGNEETLSWMSQGKLSASKSGKSDEERYFNQLRRAYQSIAGTDLPYKESKVYNENGDVILVYRDYEKDKMLARAIEEMKDNWWSQNLSGKGAMMQTIADIASGNLKFVWSSKGEHRGVEKLVFGQSVPSERKQRISYLASPEKGGMYPEAYAHLLWEQTDGNADDMEILDGVLEAIRQCPSVGKAREDVMYEYIKNHSTAWEDSERNDDVPF